MDFSTDARATAARLTFERAVARVEKVDPATSGPARLRGLALGRELRSRRRSAESYAAELESLTDELVRVLPSTPPGSSRAPGAPTAPVAS